MSLTPTISLVEFIVVLVGLLAEWSAVDNSLRAFADGGNLKKLNQNGSKRRTAYWAARNEVLIALGALVFLVGGLLLMTVPEAENKDTQLAGEVTKWLFVGLELCFLVVSSWNRYDRWRLKVDYEHEEAAQERAVALALETSPPSALSTPTVAPIASTPKQEPSGATSDVAIEDAIEQDQELDPAKNISSSTSSATLDGMTTTTTTSTTIKPSE